MTTSSSSFTTPRSGPPSLEAREVIMTAIEYSMPSDSEKWYPRAEDIFDWQEALAKLDSIGLIDVKDTRYYPGCFLMDLTPFQVRMLFLDISDHLFTRWDAVAHAVRHQYLQRVYRLVRRLRERVRLDGSMDR
jgi:hypothetical protein